MRITVSNKPVNLGQLSDELGMGLSALFPDEETGSVVTPTEIEAHGDLTETQFLDALDAHVADPDYVSPGSAKDWRDKLRAEVQFIDDQIAAWPTNATTNADALQRVNFLLAATKRIARNQSRILKFIDNATMDSG